MASESGYSIQKIQGLTEDLAAASNTAGKIELMVTPHHSYNDDALTSFNTALMGIGKEMPLSGGTGSSSVSRQQVVFIVTDGVADARQSTCAKTWVDSTRCIEPIDLSQCAALKNRNIKIAILYTTYVPQTGDHLCDTYIAPFATKIGPQLKQCASASLYFEVSPSDDMQNAMKALFLKASNTNLRLAS